MSTTLPQSIYAPIPLPKTPNFKRKNPSSAVGAEIRDPQSSDQRAKRPAITAMQPTPPFLCEEIFVASNTSMTYVLDMHTVVETEIFQRRAALIWSDAELTEFINWIAANPLVLVGDVISGSGGCRKVRWGRSGMGKRGGSRVIYFNGEDGRVWLLIAYAKAKFDNLPTEFLVKLKYEVEHG